jgi:glutaredoxin 3
MADHVVKVYSTPTCPWCRRTKQFLTNNGIPFQDMNVAEDKAARDEMINVTHQMSVPAITIDGAIIVGFKEPELREKLGLPNAVPDTNPT